MSEIKFTNTFKKQYKKVKKNPRWKPIFLGTTPFKENNCSPWDYVMNCFLKDLPVPKYFYEHSITLPKSKIKEIKQRVGNTCGVKIEALDLHFDGHNGDHLLIYAKTNQQIIY